MTKKEKAPVNKIDACKKYTALPNSKGKQRERREQDGQD